MIVAGFRVGFLAGFRAGFLVVFESAISMCKKPYLSRVTR
jgi:hypothetical protein